MLLVVVVVGNRDFDLVFTDRLRLHHGCLRNLRFLFVGFRLRRCVCRGLLVGLRLSLLFGFRFRRRVRRGLLFGLLLGRLIRGRLRRCVRRGLLVGPLLGFFRCGRVCCGRVC